MTSNNLIYYVYLYIDPNTKIPFYVGYGKGNRSSDHLNEAISKPKPCAAQHKLNKIRKLLRNNTPPIIKIVKDSLSKEDACNLEIKLILQYGRIDLKTGSLTNRTCGGDGHSEWGPNAIQMNIERFTGKVAVYDPLTNENFLISKEDPRWVNQEVIACSKGMVVCIHNDTEKRLTVSQDEFATGKYKGIQKGYIRSKETNRKHSESTTGIPKSASHREAIRLGKLKEVKTPEQIKHKSEAISSLKWFYNKELDKVKRLLPGTEPSGFIRVNGPHKRMPS